MIEAKFTATREDLELCLTLDRYLCLQGIVMNTQSWLPTRRDRHYWISWSLESATGVHFSQAAGRVTMNVEGQPPLWAWRLEHGCRRASATAHNLRYDFEIARTRPEQAEPFPVPRPFLRRFSIRV